ncbi:MAG TPA: Uma2 family endonuclease [Thermoanaerobaculia bacterium]|nr:Uma2 family endonuclease [Thermoanaerobaculia bacterium]
MAARTREKATYEDLLKAPEDKIAELIDGELYLAPRPRVRHAKIQSQLHGQIERRFSNPAGGWLILMEPEVHFDQNENALIPDLAGWRLERLSLTDDEVWMDVVPDWICEIPSPWTAAYDRRIKMPKYAHYGVRHAWIIDPPNCNVEVKRLEKGNWVEIAVLRADEPFRAEPFEELEIVLNVRWPSPSAP